MLFLSLSTLGSSVAPSASRSFVMVAKSVRSRTYRLKFGLDIGGLLYWNSGTAYTASDIFLPGSYDIYTNQQLNDDIETVFLMADAALQPIASKLVKEIARLGGSIDKFVTPAVAEDVRVHLNGGSR